MSEFKFRTNDSYLYVYQQQIRPANLSVLLLIVVALVTGGLFWVVDLTTGQNKEMRVPLLGGEEREDEGRETVSSNI